MRQAIEEGFILDVLNPASHQAKFLWRFGHLFSADETTDMPDAWKRPRDWSRGVLQAFRREAVFMPLKRHPTIPAKLGRIGRPVIVEARLPAGTAASLPLAEPLLSAYHRTIRPDAHAREAETYVRQPVLPGDIMAVTLV